MSSCATFAENQLHFVSLYAKFADNLVKPGSMKHGWNKQLMMGACSRIVLCTEKSFLPRCWIEHRNKVQLSNVPVPERDGEREMMEGETEEDTEGTGWRGRDGEDGTEGTGRKGRDRDGTAGKGRDWDRDGTEATRRWGRNGGEGTERRGTG